LRAKELNTRILRLFVLVSGRYVKKVDTAPAKLHDALVWARRNGGRQASVTVEISRPMMPVKIVYSGSAAEPLPFVPCGGEQASPTPSEPR